MPYNNWYLFVSCDIGIVFLPKRIGADQNEEKARKMSSLYSILDVLRDPAWNGIAGIAGIVSVMSLFLTFQVTRNVIIKNLRLSKLTSLTKSAPFLVTFLVSLLVVVIIVGYRYGFLHTALIAVTAVCIFSLLNSYDSQSKVSSVSSDMQQQIDALHSEHAEEVQTLTDKYESMFMQSQELNQTITRILSLHNNPVRYEEWNIDEYIYSNGDGVTDEYRLIYADGGIVYFQSSIVGFTESDKNISIEDINFHAINANTKEPLHIVRQELVVNSARYTLLLDPPATENKAFPLNVKIRRANLWVNLLNTGVDVAEVSSQCRVDKLRIRFFPMDGLQVTAVRGLPAQYFDQDFRKVTAKGKIAFSATLTDVTPGLYTFNIYRQLPTE